MLYTTIRRKELKGSLGEPRRKREFVVAVVYNVTPSDAYAKRVIAAVVVIALFIAVAKALP